MKKAKLLPPIKHQGGGCICCSSLGHELPIEQILYQGFGGWHIEKNGHLYYMADSYDENPKTLSDIELIAKTKPHWDWRAVCFTPLHGETYQRQNGKWLLVEQNEGFA